MYHIKVVTRDDPRNMILKYKKHEIKFNEDYREYRRFRIYTTNGYKWLQTDKIIITWNNFHEIDNVFTVNIGVINLLKKNILKEIDVTNIEIDSIIKEKLRFT